MKLIVESALALLLTSGSTWGDAPQYDLKTEASFEGSITEIGQMPASQPLEGMFIKIKTKVETVTIFLGPLDFIKVFDFTFRKGDDVAATGSRVKFGDGDLILVRTITIGKITLTFRDPKGNPNWLWMKRIPIPTGL